MYVHMDVQLHLRSLIFCVTLLHQVVFTNRQCACVIANIAEKYSSCLN